jgi:hypothetical protein
VKKVIEDKDGHARKNRRIFALYGKIGNDKTVLFSSISIVVDLLELLLKEAIYGD